MAYIIVAILSMIAGAACAAIFFERQNKNVKATFKKNLERTMEIKNANSKLNKKTELLQAKIEDFNTTKKNYEIKFNKIKENIKTEKLASEKSMADAEKLFAERTNQTERELEFERNEFRDRREQDQAEFEKSMTAQKEYLQNEFDQKIISYDELEQENNGLKQDVYNLHVQTKKQDLDNIKQREKNDEIEVRINEMGDRYLQDNIKWISKSLTQNNFVNSKKKLTDSIERCRKLDYEVSFEDEENLQLELRDEFEKIVRAAFLKEEQARIKSQIRDEQKREKEIQKELDQLEREREAIQVALEKALAEATDQHSEEVERLKARLAEAEEKSKRAVSQAQLTKSGHVYIISNIGAFGEDVYKIGMTRRLEPEMRIKELSGAAVPFPFDVHMMISSDDAPSLENSLHRTFHHNRINKINPRKEFFRIDLNEIISHVKEQNAEIDYVIDAEAMQYRQSLEILDDDADFINDIYDDLNGDGDFDED